MKTTLTTSFLTAILGLGLLTTTGLAQNTGNQQMNPGMMQGRMGGQGMMNMRGGGMMGPGMMGDQSSWGMMGCNGMMGTTMMNQMSPGQRQAFLDKTRDLRRQMLEKRFAYMEAMRKPETTPQELAKIEKEMLSLRAKMMDVMSSIQSGSK